jgi:hypothetical protein
MTNPEVNKLKNNPEILHIAVNLPVAIDANLKNEVATIINTDLNATNNLLAGNIPRVIAHYQDPQTAESAARCLRNLGLAVIICKDSEIHQFLSPIFTARALKFGQGEIVFQDKIGKERIIKTEDVFLIIKGTAQLRKEKIVTKTKKKLNLPLTLMTGGIPIRSKVEEQIVESSIQREFFIRLYHRKSSFADVEIPQYSFDYSCLGKNMAATTLVNFQNLSTKIKELCPQSVFDDRLTRSITPGTSLLISPNNKNIQCKLIYLFHEIASTPGSSAS